MPKCDICGEEFDTERGLHIHQSQKHDEEAEDVETEEVEDSDSDSEDEAEDAGSSDEVVREIEEETAGGLLGGFSRESLVVGGTLIGIALGLALGLFLSQSSGINEVGPAEVESKMEGLPGAQLNVTSVTKQNGVYAVNASSRSITGQTVERTIAHVSLDGGMVFLQGVQYDQLKERLQQTANNQTATPNSNQTAAENTTAP